MFNPVNIGNKADRITVSVLSKTEKKEKKNEND